MGGNSTMVESPPVIGGDQLQTNCVLGYVALRGTVCLLLLSGRAPGQRVAQVEEHHAQMSVFRRSSCDEPRIPRNIGVLTHEIQGAVFPVFHDGLGESAGDFLNVAVLTRGSHSAGGPVSNGRRAVGIERGVLKDINTTVVGVEKCLVVGELEAGNGRAIPNWR